MKVTFDIVSNCHGVVESLLLEEGCVASLSENALELCVSSD
ncbi:MULTISPECIES: hypothetical protein [Brevibacillus]|jgi:hypothetical protein|nr:hypothetical protein [Brevibacillus nitrificans]MDR7316822.1 hypothetical protein [Brevibacillus nitrificans]